MFVAVYFMNVAFICTCFMSESQMFIQIRRLKFMCISKCVGPFYLYVLFSGGDSAFFPSGDGASCSGEKNLNGIPFQ